MQSFTRRLRGRPGAPLAGLRQFITAALLAHRASNVAVKIAGPYASPFHQVTCGVDVPVTATQVFEP
jgi:hypothetical protein